jgi:hypothetical protein
MSIYNRETFSECFTIIFKTQVGVFQLKIKITFSFRFYRRIIRYKLKIFIPKAFCSVQNNLG